MKTKSLPLLAALASSTIFAFAYFFTIRALNATQNDVARLLAFRLTTCVLVMTILRKTGIFKINVKGKDIRLLLVCGALVPCICFSCEYIALGNGFSTSSQIAMFYAMMPVIVTILGILILGERPALRQYCFMALSVIGLIIINWGVNFKTTHPLGLLLPAITVLASCFNCILLRKTSDRFSAIETVYVTSCVGAVAFTTFSLGQHLIAGRIGGFFDGVFTWPFISAILYLSIMSSTFGFMMSNYMVAQLPPVVSSSFAGFSTILTITNGVLLLGDSIGVKEVAGCALILIGALLMNAGYRAPANKKIQDESETELETIENAAQQNESQP